MNKSTRLLALLGAAVIAASACTSGGGASTAPSAAAPTSAATAAASAPASAGASASAAAFDPSTVDPKSLLGVILSSGKIRISTDPNYKPFSFLNTDDEHVRGLRHLDRRGDRQAPERQARQGHHDRLADAGLGPDHRRQLGRPLGHLDRLDERDRRSRQGRRLRRPVLLRLGRRRRPEGLAGPVAVRARWRQDVLRRRRDHLRAVAQGHARDRRPEHRQGADHARCHLAPDRQRVRPGRQRRPQVRCHRGQRERPGRRGQDPADPRARRVPRSSPCRSRSRSTRAVPTTRRCSPCSTRSSATCMPTARSRSFSTKWLEKDVTVKPS